MQSEGATKILQVLEKYPDVNFAILFGSMASGTDKPESDVDLAVLCDKVIGSDLKSDLIQALALSLGRPIDLVDLRRVGLPLMGEILLKGQRLLGTDSAYATLLSRYLFDKADFYPYKERLLRERREKWIRR